MKYRCLWAKHWKRLSLVINLRPCWGFGFYFVIQRTFATNYAFAGHYIHVQVLCFGLWLWYDVKTLADIKRETELADTLADTAKAYKKAVTGKEAL